MSISYQFASLISLLSFTFPVVAQEPAATIDLKKDITYRKIADKELQLDIAMPTGKGPFPAVVCVHGGAWRLGSRKDLSKLIELIAKEGFVGVTVSYRLIPDAKFPDPIEDCKTAVRFLRAHAGEYRIDKNYIGAVGFSAGGHLVALLGTTDAKAGFDGKDYPDQSSAVQAVVSYFGPTDLSYYGKDESAQKSTFVPLLGARFQDKPELYEKASPLFYANKNCPPFLFLHGTRDSLVPIEQSRELFKKLKGFGVSAEIIEVEGAGHGWAGVEQKKSTEATFKFFKEKLKK